MFCPYKNLIIVRAGFTPARVCDTRANTRVGPYILWAADPSKLRRPVHICPLICHSRTRREFIFISHRLFSSTPLERGARMADRPAGRGVFLLLALPSTSRNDGIMDVQ